MRSSGCAYVAVFLRLYTRAFSPVLSFFFSSLRCHAFLLLAFFAAAFICLLFIYAFYVVYINT